MKKHYKPKLINITKSLIQIKMTDLRDTLQVGLANGSAIGVSLVGEVNEYLTLLSLLLAISFTIYKFVKFKKWKN